MKKVGKIFCYLILLIAYMDLNAENKNKDTNDHYWEWGIGVTNISATRNFPLDVARYDWSIIDLGNISTNKDTLALLNNMLKINPKHKLFLRVWPIVGLGKCPENRNQMTLFDYYYTDGVKKKVLQKAKEQVEFFVKGLDKPENLVGMSFLEELPAHISSNGWIQWKKGEPLPWEIKAFEKEIEKELGAPFDMMNPEHRLWWGKKYSDMLCDVHMAMKEGGRKIKIIYWHQSAMTATLDSLQDGETMIDKMGRSPVPIYYKDVVKAGICDGIFGYPGNQEKERCVTPAEKLDCLYFSQISFPAFMRRLSWKETVEIAMKRDPRNLGTVIHGELERGAGTWNQLPWARTVKGVTRAENFRMFGYVDKIGMDIIKRELVPEVKFDYKVEGMKQGDFAHVFVQIFNPVSPSWYGGNETEATMKNLIVKLDVPEGYDLPSTNSAPPLIHLGDLKPYECIAGDWWLRKNEAASSVPFILKATVMWSNGRKIVVEGKKSDEEISPFQFHYVINSEEKWVEPAYRLQDFVPAVQVIPMGRDLVAPELLCGYSSVKYNDVLDSDEMLTIGPGFKAEISQKPLFTGNACRFESDNPAFYDKGYMVYRTQKVQVKSGKKYIFKLSGRAADGGNSLVGINFICGQEKKEIKAFENKFDSEMKTYETEITVPEFKSKNQIFMWICFYRLNQKGTVTYKDFSLTGQEKSRDVSYKLQGVLCPLEKNFTIWQFKDSSNCDYYGNPKAAIRFFNPDGVDNKNEGKALPYF